VRAQGAGGVEACVDYVPGSLRGADGNAVLGSGGSADVRRGWGGPVAVIASGEDDDICLGGRETG